MVNFLYGYFNSIFTHSFWWVFTEYPFGKFNRWRIGEQFNPCFLRLYKPSIKSSKQGVYCISKISTGVLKVPTTLNPRYLFITPSLRIIYPLFLLKIFSHSVSSVFSEIIEMNFYQKKIVWFFLWLFLNQRSSLLAKFLKK